MANSKVTPMLKLAGEQCSVARIDQHSYICDLINVDGPILALYRDQRLSWLYLWVDTNGYDTNRWLVFPIEREALVEYLKRQKSLLDAVRDAARIFSLDVTGAGGEKLAGDEDSTRRRLSKVSIDVIGEYLPASDSFFDETLTTDISLAYDIAPNKYVVPIDGSWFLPDLDKFSRAYTRLYSFFYCTKPRFVTNIGQKLDKYLHSPWQGGYSRINMFDALHKLIPAVHDTRVAKFQYASPGDVTIEALPSVGDSIMQAVLAYIKNYDEVRKSVGAIDGTLAQLKLKKSNLSKLNDSQLSIPEDSLKAIQHHTKMLAYLLCLEEELASVTTHSPNSVVTSKATLAVLTQVGRLAEYQRTGMLDFERAKD